MNKDTLFGSCSESASCKACLSMLTPEVTKDTHWAAQARFLKAYVKGGGNSQLATPYFCQILENNFMGATFIVSIGPKLSKEPQYFLKLLRAILATLPAESLLQKYQQNLSKFDHRRQN